MVKIFAVIPTRDRSQELANLLGDIPRSVDIIVIDNNSSISYDAGDATVLMSDDDPPNISVLWNMGLDEASLRADGDPYHVAVLNDDLRLRGDVLGRLSEVLSTSGAAITFPDMHGHLRPGAVDICRKEGPYDLFARMTGYCFMLRGDLELRADETLQWWFSDDDLEWRASQLGGVARIGGCDVKHLYPSASTNARPELTAQAGVDRGTFIEKWGRAPW